MIDENTASAIAHKRETGHSLTWTFSGDWACENCEATSTAARAAHTPTKEDT